MKHLFFNKLMNQFLFGFPSIAGAVLLLSYSIPVTAQNDNCLKSCHEDKSLAMERDGKPVSMFVDMEKFLKGGHSSNECIECHEDADEMEDEHHYDELDLVDCSICHDDVTEIYENSIHAESGIDKSINAACTDCHDIHNMKMKTDHKSPTFTLNIPFLCARCHQEDKKATVSYEGDSHEIIENYSMSIHGKGLLKSGLVVTATCISCHTPHGILPADEPDSSVHKDNISKTCAKCHVGILEKFELSIHSSKVSQSKEKLPQCNDCHSSHTVNRVELDHLRNNMMEQCGQCHEDLTKHYFESFHGKASALGWDKAAKCFDCHGSHTVLPASNPESSISKENIVQTCAQCHENSNENFTAFISHANEHDKDKFPRLYYSYWSMTLLLLGTFGFFGIHTGLWLYRGLRERKSAGRHHRNSERKKKEIQRFDPFSRILHVMIILSFISLAVTGMTLKFAHIPVFQIISRIMGGYVVTGFIHRVAAFVTFLYFVLHIGYLFNKKRKRQIKWKDLIVGERTLFPRLRDLVEFWHTLKWFFGKGPKPAYGRWTYWEKFDYFAVFWGVGIIGISGIILWFPEFVTLFHLPGNMINIAMIIHSDEALLATGFIFTIHFFNTQFRPEKFPMDTVIFTGSISLEEFKEERPREYELAVKEGRLEDLLVDPPHPKFARITKIFGMICLALGLLTVLMIIYSLI